MYLENSISFISTSEDAQPQSKLAEIVKHECTVMELRPRGLCSVKK